MKRHIVTTAIVLAALLVSSCEEFSPVFSFGYADPQTDGQYVQPGEITPNCTIAELAGKYVNGKPFVIEEDLTIAGRVISSDKTGNFYNQIFIQDETGGIEVKIGKNSLCNDYALGQMVYVKCGPQGGSKGLTLGSYGYKSGNYGGNGMVQLGSEFFAGTYGTDYETTYIRSEYIINQHVFRGTPDDIVLQEPVVLTESQLPTSSGTIKTCPYLGRLVTLKGLRYGNEAFALLYISGEESGKNSNNRVFLSDQTWGIDSWAMSKTNFLQHLRSGEWDEALVGNSGDNVYGSVGEVDPDYLKDTDMAFYESVLTDDNFARNVFYWVYGYYPETGDPNAAPEELVKKWVRYKLAKNANGYSVSQSFYMGSTEIQLRTSGFSRFADQKIPQEVLDGSATVDITGILSLYQGSIQFTVNSLDDIVVNK